MVSCPWSLIARPLVAGLLLATSPFALWQSQDAKVYSLLMLGAALLLWLLLRALRTGARRDWLALLAVALGSLFVHRLAILGCAGALVALALTWPPRRFASSASARGFAYARWAGLGAALLCAGVAIYGTASAVGTESRGGTGHVPAGPIAGLWLSLAHFALDNGNINGWLGLPLIVWAAPALALTLWGLARLALDAHGGSVRATALLCMLLVPLGLFATALAFVRLFEARYVTVAYPAWALTLAYPFGSRRTTNDERPTATDDRRPPSIDERPKANDQRPKTIDERPKTNDQRPLTNDQRRTTSEQGLGSRLGMPGPWSLVPGPRSLIAAVLLVNAAVLVQPQHGLFSGAAVKEQWRDAVSEIARRAHPDDLLILHPYYAQPMWDYYAPRVTPDPLPRPVVFDTFGYGNCGEIYKGDDRTIAECYGRTYDQDFNRAALGKKRALLLIAPEHARTIDPPKKLKQLLEDYQKVHRPGEPPPTEDDRYGRVGLRFQFSPEQRSWPCGGERFLGVEVMCQSYPSTFRAGGSGTTPQPAVRLDAVFGGELHLRGYSLDLLGGEARPGGTLPITLYWDAAAKPSHDYRMFLHLCRDCAIPPLANADGYPLEGMPPAGRTTTWIVGDPVHDERSLALPRDLAPGRYTLLLGVYPEANPSEAARLPVSRGAPTLGGTRLVLGEVTIAQP